MTLQEIIALMRKERVRRIEEAWIDDASGGRWVIGAVELHPSAFAAAAAAESLDTAPAPIGIENGGEPTEEQALMWSAGGPLPKAQGEEQ